jgi:CelD/BcsL family acetyltransferase involved in cellulose biosynthesis
VLEEIPDDSELRRSWNKLALGMERPEVFYTFDWAIAVQRAYRNSLTPLVFLAYEGESLVSLVALAKRKQNDDVVFLAADTADYCDFLGEAGRRQEFVEAVLSELKHRRNAKVVLANLPTDSLSVICLPHAASTCRYRLNLRPAYLCARVVLGSVEERAVVKQSVTSKKRLRRNMRELEKRGRVRIQHDTSWNQIEPALHPFMRAHVARFLETGKISNLIREERRAFLSELARELTASGWLALSRLYVEDATAAWNYGFRFSRTWFWYQPTVNKKYGDFSPGYCLLAKIVERACDSDDVSVVDLGLGAEAYKDRFATANRQTLYCELNSSLSSHLRTVARNRAAAVAKASPRIEKWIRALISQVASLKQRLRDIGFWGLLTSLFRRIWSSLFAVEEVFFYEWPDQGQNAQESNTLLRPLDSDLVGEAAIIYANDPSSLRYLMRSMQRLYSGQEMGFALLTPAGTPVHFCWAGDFEGFEMAELGRTLRAPYKEAVLIFDCFTPACIRGHGFFAQAIAGLADRLRSQGKSPWIFGAATNQASLRGIQKARFQYRFSLRRKKIFFLFQRKDSIPSAEPGKTARPVPIP